MPLHKDRVFFFDSFQKIIARGSGGTRVANIPREDEITGAIDPTVALLLKRLHKERISSAPPRGWTGTSAGTITLRAIRLARRVSQRWRRAAESV